MSPPLLELDRVVVALGGKEVVRAVSAVAPAGRLIALVGPNGAGKSTLLRAIAGRLPFAGGIRLAGRALADWPRSERVRLIGYLPQGHQTHWPLPVRDIVGLGRFAHGAPDPRRLTGLDLAAVEAAAAATGIQALMERPATDLSGGEKARVALARVIAQEARLILADEPTASLDPRYQLEIAALLKRLAGGGALVLAVTHDLAHAAHFADQVMVMQEGRIVENGPPDQALGDAVLAKVFGVRAASDAAHARVPWEITG